MEQTNPPDLEKRVVERGQVSDLVERKRQHSSGSEDDDASKVRKVEEVIAEETPLKNVPLFLIISNKEEGRSLSKVSPFLINKSLVSAGGQPAAVRKLRSGQLLVEATNGVQASRYLKMTSFFGQYDVKVEPHSSLNSSKGIVFCRDLLECTTEEIKEELEGASVTEVVRITRRENGENVPTPGLILTFDAPHPPQKIRAGYLSIPVKPYFRNPQRCYKCQRFGHSSKACPNQETCGRCGEEGHNDSNCEGEEFCCNCGGKHQARSRNCKKYIEEKEILKIATLEKLSFFDARKEFRRRQSNMSQRTSASASYSQAVSASLQPSQCSSCSKLEGMVQALTEQVSALVNILSSSADITPIKPTTQTFASTVSAESAASSPAANQSSTAKQIKPTIPKKTGAIPKTRPSPPSITAEDRKKLVEKLKKQVSSNKNVKSKDFRNSPSMSSSSRVPSLEEDMILDNMDSQTEFQTLTGTFRTGKKENLYKLTFYKLCRSFNGT